MEKSLPTPEITSAIAARFWSKVDKTEGHGPHGDCWVWTAAIAYNGYPAGLGIAGHKYRASHIALALAGKVRPGDLHALHSCDNKVCVRPDHLRWGTTEDNAQDYLERRGNGPRWLHPDIVREIRASSERNVDIARRLGITPPAVWHIRKGLTHKHVT